MGLATLAGRTCTHARVQIPAWGASYADVTLDGEFTISGKATLVIADLTIQGTVLSGGPGTGRSFYRIVAGGGGWGKLLPSKSYSNDAGVKLATVLGDAASEAGETLDASTLDQSAALASYWVRPADQACRILEQVASKNWYVGEDGKTRIGQRPGATLKASATLTSQTDLARGTVTLASDAIAAILPGVTVNGIAAVDVEHEFTPDSGLRTTLWGQQNNTNSRRIAALRAILQQLFPNIKFAGLYEYRIVTQDGERLNLQPVRVSLGMPTLSRVMVRPGLPGCKAQHSLGSRVVVGFVNADATKPVVVSFEDAESSGFVPPLLDLAGGGPAVARTGDQVQVFLPPTLPVVGTVSGSPFTGTITVSNPITGQVTGGSAKVTSG